MAQLQVSDVMTRGVRSLSPDDTLLTAAQAMAELGIGAIPVCQGDQVVGMLTDRDIVVRGVAQGRPAADARLADLMSADVRCCFEDQAVDEVLDQMCEVQIRRVPVLDRAKHLVGILSLGDLAVRGQPGDAGEALLEISQPAQPDLGVDGEFDSLAGEPPTGGSVSGQARRSPRTRTARNDPVADWTVGTDGQRGRATEAGLNTDSRGGPGSAAEAGRQSTDPAGLYDEESTEPRAGTRLGEHSSQGLFGAEDGGGGEGGAERGANEPPARGRSGQRSGNEDDSGVDRTGGA